MNRMFPVSTSLVELEPSTQKCLMYFFFGLLLRDETDRTVRKPDFVGLYPQNVTIMEGSTARLQCRVISDTPLFLQWLKRLDRLSPYEAHRQAVGGVENGRPDSDGVLQVPNYCSTLSLLTMKSIQFYNFKHSNTAVRMYI